MTEYTNLTNRKLFSMTDKKTSTIENYQYYGTESTTSTEQNHQSDSVKGNTNIILQIHCNYL